ncbi:MAG: hypothetical protein JXR96_22270 [Deltaproteobacteria bacterium]|nr:hypothetical protein [Deltaproteobacteria bacterium]
MKNGVILLSMLFWLCVACTSKEAAPAAQNPKPGLAPAAGERPSASGKTLASYLKDTRQISLWKYEHTGSGLDRGEPVTISQLEKVRAILEVIDLEQKIHAGGLAKCPDDFRLAFRDGAGAELGSIGICGGVPSKFEDPYKLAARFDGPRKGELGGIGLTDGKAMMTLIHEQLAAAEPRAEPGGTCHAEGESYEEDMAGGEKIPCCPGLVSIREAVYDPKTGACSFPRCPCFVCTRCGDGKCGQGENKCNCPKDCPN